jgi:uncharacterized protein (DUF1778 family)
MASLPHAAKTERLEMRLTRSQKKRIAEAAKLQGKTVSEFAATTLHDAASRVIEEQNTITLTRKASEMFVQLLMNPPHPNEKLLRAGREYREWAGSHVRKGV